MNLHSYPKVYAVGHRAIAELFIGDVLVEEKVDGSQAQWVRLFMSERDKANYWKVKADPVKYAAYLERKRAQRKAAQESRLYETERKRRWRAANPDHRKLTRQAGNAVEVVLRRGEIVRPKECSNCGKVGKIEAHHHKGYAPENWLEIVWLCVYCHRKADEKL